MHTQNTQTDEHRSAVASPWQDVGHEPVPQQYAISVRVADIATRRDWQVRETINPHLVRDYITHYAHGANMPPVTLANVDGTLVLVDGWHRLRAQQQLGREEIDAFVEELSEEEAQWQAALANTRNGARLTRRSEKRRVFELYMQQGRNRVGSRGLKSYRQIARDLGGLASKSAIENWMKRVFPKVAAKMRSGRDDNTGAAPDIRPSPVEVRIREALRQAVAEARGVPCLGKRLAFARGFAKDILEIKPWAPEPIENNDDF